LMVWATPPRRLPRREAGAVLTTSLLSREIRTKRFQPAAPPRPAPSGAPPEGGHRPVQGSADRAHSPLCTSLDSGRVLAAFVGRSFSNLHTVHRGVESSCQGPHWASSRLPGRCRRHASPRTPRKAGHGGRRGGGRVPEGRQPSPPIWPRPCRRDGDRRRDGHPPSRPAAASGTLNSLCRVLCTVRSLYLYAIGLGPVSGPCEGWTSRFKLQFQEALLAGERGVFPRPADGVRLHGAVTLGCAPFQATF